MMEAFLACCVRFSAVSVPSRQDRHHSADNKHVGTQPVNHQVCALCVCVCARAPSECIDT
jgi:hypothetical protein